MSDPNLEEVVTALREVYIILKGLFDGERM